MAIRFRDIPEQDIEAIYNHLLSSCEGMRCKWMQWTFLNVFWHKVKGMFKANSVPQFLNHIQR